VAAVVGTGGAAGGIIAKAHAIQKGISTAKKIYDVVNKAKKIKSIADKAKKAKNVINKLKKIKSKVSKITENKIGFVSEEKAKLLKIYDLVRKIAKKNNNNDNYKKLEKYFVNLNKKVH
jgi:glycine cleavage system pyridoxal-binding protein P